MADARPIYVIVSTFTTNDKQIRIPKLRVVENYRPWFIHIQTTLESKRWIDIVTETQKTIATSRIDSTNFVKKEISKYI